MKVLRKFPTTRPYIVESILPAHTVHILAGASGAGKTRLLFGLLSQWIKGEDVLGFKSNPVPYVYIAGDRDLASVHDTLIDIGLNPNEIPIIPALELEPITGYSLVWLFKTIQEWYPEAQLIILEALSAFVPPGKLNDNQNVGKFLRDLIRYCKKHKMTVIALHHTAKEKANDKYASPREKMLGSGAFAGYSETNLILERVASDDPENPYRRLYVSPRNKVREFVVNYKFDPGGIPRQLTDVSKLPAQTPRQFRGRPRDTIVNDALKTLFDRLQMEGKTEFTLADAADAVGSQKTAQRRLEEMCATGLVEKRGHGTYFLAGLVRTQEVFGALLG